MEAALQGAGHSADAALVVPSRFDMKIVVLYHK